MRMKLPWMANTRPDCIFEISQVEKLTEARFEEDKHTHIKMMNKEVSYAVDTDIHLKISKSDIESIKIFGFFDASIANN